MLMTIKIYVLLCCKPCINLLVNIMILFCLHIELQQLIYKSHACHFVTFYEPTHKGLHNHKQISAQRWEHWLISLIFCRKWCNMFEHGQEERQSHGY